MNQTSAPTPVLNLAQTNANPLPGTKCKVLSNSNGHGSPIGAIVTVVSCAGSSIRVRETGSSYTKTDLALVKVDRAHIQQEIRTLQSEIMGMNNKLDFMDETGLAEFDESEFKAYRVLQTLDNDDLSQVERAQVVAELIKG